MMGPGNHAAMDQMLKESRWAYDPNHLPRPIAWDQMQVGDTIQAEKDIGVDRMARGKVALSEEAHAQIRDGGEVRWLYSRDGWSLILIDRPEPERPAGSLWYHPRLDAGFVRTDAVHPESCHYVGFTGIHHGSQIVSYEPTTIAELIPWAERPDAAGDSR